MEFLQKIYANAPILGQHVMTTVAGFQKNSNRYGDVYKQYRQWLAKFDTWSLDEKLAYQLKELKRFLDFAIEHSEFYKARFPGFDSSKIDSLADLRQLPLLGKEELRTNIDQVVTVPRKKAVESHTGGTTGKSLVVRHTVEDSMKRMAMLDHFKARHGFEHRRMRRATFMGKHIVPPRSKKSVFWRYNHSCKQMLYSSFHITERNLPLYVQSLNQFQPLAIDGFFTAMLDVARHIERHELPLTFQPIAIFPTSETITAEGRATLERVFGAKVYNQYASSEGAPFVTECEYGQLHIEHSTGIFEHLDGQSNEILVTSFQTHGTPLVRYAIGDRMKFQAAGGCACHNETLLVKAIEGRRDDYLLRADGAKINAGVAANLFKNMPNSVIRAQIVQSEIDHITILLIVDEAKHSLQYDQLLREEVSQVFGETTSLTIKHVSEIQREKSGKYRLIKNKLTQTEPNH